RTQHKASCWPFTILRSIHKDVIQMLVRIAVILHKLQLYSMLALRGKIELVIAAQLSILVDEHTINYAGNVADIVALHPQVRYAGSRRVVTGRRELQSILLFTSIIDHYTGAIGRTSGEGYRLGHSVQSKFVLASHRAKRILP